MKGLNWSFSWNLVHGSTRFSSAVSALPISTLRSLQSESTRSVKPPKKKLWTIYEQRAEYIWFLVAQVGILITGTPSVESVSLCWPSSTRDSYPIMTPWQPMAEPSHYLLSVKGRHHQRPQVRYSYCSFILFWKFCTFHLFLVWLEKLLQGLKIRWVQGRHYYWKPRSLCLPAPLPAPQRALWRHHSLPTWTAHLRLPLCVDLPLLQNNARRGRAHCRAHMWWGEVWSSGPHPQVRQGGSNHHYFILYVTLGIKLHLNWGWSIHTWIGRLGWSSWAYVWALRLGLKGQK